METVSKNKFMVRIFTVLAFMAVTGSSFCQNSDEITTNTAEEVESYDFAVVDGIVYSAGTIAVYDVAGKLVTTASQEFNVNSLAAGVYFIGAKEGAISLVKYHEKGQPIITWKIITKK